MKIILSRKGFDSSDGMSASRWKLFPDFMRNVSISYHSEKSWKENYFQSVGRGQEFVFSADENPQIMKWVSNLIGANHP
jgi:hypothetical protein